MRQETLLQQQPSGIYTTAQHAEPLISFCDWRGDTKHMYPKKRLELQGAT